MDLRNTAYEVKKEGVALLTVNRPDKLNALNRATLEEIGLALDEAELDGSVGALVVTGAGDKAFVAGADIGEIAELDAAAGRRFALFGQNLFRRIETFPKPVIGAINGFALGGGCELAMACHVRLASETAQFGQPEINLGIIPGYGGTQRLSRLVGRGIALEILLSGDRIPAQRAYEIGLVNAVVPKEELLARALALGARFASKAPLAARYILEAVQAGLEMPVEEGCYLEATLFALSCASEDMKEGTKAFLEKRKPSFRGR